ncbi:MAG: hypothetical protein IJI67_03220 [Clostridia bacterium]|nr:hypothetical protein [Clostridia bacterium]
MLFKQLKQKREKPLPVFFGTDWWSDCDDVAALDILLKAQCFDLVDIKAVGINSVMQYSAPSLQAVCAQYGLGEIPIGLVSSARRKGILCLYQKKLAAFCQSGLTNADCPEAYKLYRRELAALSEKAVIIDVGFPGLLMELLQSSPDEISDLSGVELVKEKVAAVIVMGGCWDKPGGKEYNFSAYKGNRTAAAYLCDHCPVPLIFLGYEVGKNVITGGRAVPGLTGTAYAAHFSGKGRPSWDPMAALFAVIGDAETAGYRLVRGKAAVDPASGKNSFVSDEKGSHAYLLKTKEDDFYKEQIDAILMMEIDKKEGRNA